MMMKVALVHTTSQIGHHGCTLVNRRIEALSAAAGLQITRRFPLQFDETAEDWGRYDAILLNGEGSLHHDRRAAKRIAALGGVFERAGRPAYLINTIYEENGPEVAEGVARYRRVYTRDGASQAALARAGIAAIVVPDLSLTWEPGTALAPKGGRLVVGDSVHKHVSAALWGFARAKHAPFFSMMTTPPVIPDFADRNRKHRLRHAWRRATGLVSPKGATRARFWNEFKSFEDYTAFLAKSAALVVTGRFHQLCIGFDMEIPVVAVSSNTRKLESLCADAGIAGRVVPTAAEAAALVEREGLSGLAYTPDEIANLRRFRAGARDRAAAMFRTIAGGG